MNNDPEQSGMFEDNCRVKAIKLRGELSEGFILPAITLENYLLSVTNINYECKEGTEFDACEHEGKTFWINKKYIPKNVQTPGVPGSRKERGKQPKGIDRLIENQFRFHYSTVIIKKCPHVIHPNDIISLTAKVHGCVEANTPIETSEGIFTIKEIVDTKKDVLIKAFDTNLNQIVWVPIDNYYTIPNDGDWY